MFTELLNSAKTMPRKPVLFPPITDREVWDRLPCAERWLAAGKDALAAMKKANGLPALPLSLWLDFTQTGCRARYEQAYFTRRRTLCALVMAECIGYTGQYIPAIADAAWAICEESAWQLPAHNTYLRDAPQLPLPDPTRPIIDLFAAETGALLSMTYLLLARQLNAHAPGLPWQLKTEVQRRILRPYLCEHFWWMGNGDEPMCNWTPWCTQNVLLCAAVFVQQRSLPRYIRQAAYSLDCFLKDYGTDGCCSEGAQYYRHAALTLWGAAELLCAMQPGVFDSVWRDKKLKNMAEYIVNMHAAGDYYLNFADCSPIAGRRGVREYLFGKRVGSAPLRALAAQDRAAAVRAPDPDALHHPDTSEGISLYYHLLAALNEAEVLGYAKAAARRARPTPKNCFYPSVGILVARQGSYLLGAKAGNNADSHNHNDVGSVTLYKDGAPLLIDIGVETYSKKTFSPQRYEIWAMQSSWHNLPEFDPEGAACQQQAGAQFAARGVEVNDDLTQISMDIAPAYGVVPGLSHYRRTAALSDAGLTLTDETDYPQEVALTLMSVPLPAASGGTVNFGSLAQAKISGGVSRITTEAVPVSDARLRQAWPQEIYRTRIYFTHTLKMELC